MHATSHTERELGEYRFACYHYQTSHLLTGLRGDWVRVGQPANLQVFGIKAQAPQWQEGIYNRRKKAFVSVTLQVRYSIERR